MRHAIVLRCRRRLNYKSLTRAATTPAWTTSIPATHLMISVLDDAISFSRRIMSLFSPNSSSFKSFFVARRSSIISFKDFLCALESASACASSKPAAFSYFTKANVSNVIVAMTTFLSQTKHNHATMKQQDGQSFILRRYSHGNSRTMPGM